MKIIVREVSDLDSIRRSGRGVMRVRSSESRAVGQLGGWTTPTMPLVPR